MSDSFTQPRQPAQHPALSLVFTLRRQLPDQLNKRPAQGIPRSNMEQRTALITRTQTQLGTGGQGRQYRHFEGASECLRGRSDTIVVAVHQQLGMLQLDPVTAPLIEQLKVAPTATDAGVHIPAQLVC